MRKRLIGRVVSDKMDKTRVVLIERKVRYPIYKKIVKRFTRLSCHDEEGKTKEGDKVLIEETRPISKTKHFRIVKKLVR